jgi:tRNA(Ile2) C34 agmatinyltransferase TiaS
MKAKPRPICPECGSADVVVGNKTGTCNRCGETFHAKAAFDYPGGLGEGIQRSSTEERQMQIDDDVCSDQFRRSGTR